MNVSLLTNSVTLLFLLTIISYYILLFWPHHPLRGRKKHSCLTVIIPAHNEERYIGPCLEHVLAARYKGTKHVIVIDDGSTDRTAAIAKRYPVKVLRQQHKGKSASINRALRKVQDELFAIVDADSFLEAEALEKAVPYLRQNEVAVVCGTVKVKNRKTFLGMWLHIEQLYNSLIRELFTKMNVNIVTPGPLSIYKKAAVMHVGGFETKSFSEDVDIAVRLLKAGYRIEFAAESVSETNMPVSWRGFWRQRTRFARGWINILKRHLKLNRTVLEIYTLPLALFWYVQAVIMGSVMLWQLGQGYLHFFVSKGLAFSTGAARFFLEWLSAIGITKWIISIIQGTTPLTLGVSIAVAATLLSYPLYLIAILRYDKRLDIWHLIPLFFMFPFWLLIMIIYILMLPEYFRKEQHNIWEK